MVLRERLKAKPWPVGDMMALVELIADPRTVIVEDSKIRLTDEQARAILALTLARLTGLGRDDIFGEAKGLAHSLAQGSACASEAFFPFPDGLLEAAAAGATAVIQPGGAMRDADVIAAADEAGLAMAFTGVRVFRH